MIEDRVGYYVLIGFSTEETADWLLHEKLKGYDGDILELTTTEAVQLKDKKRLKK